MCQKDHNNTKQPKQLPGKLFSARLASEELIIRKNSNNNYTYDFYVTISVSEVTKVIQKWNFRVEKNQLKN